MALVIPDTDYTNKDFDSLVARVERLVDTAFPEWTERSKANFGNILKELPSHVGDALFFYLDKAARESRISSAQLRKSLLGLCKLIGYRPPGASAATAQEVFTLEQVLAGTLTIAKGQKVKTAEVTAPIKFQLLEDLIFLPGELEKTVTVEHSEFAQDTFTSNSQADQRVTLRKTPYLDLSAIIVDASGTYSLVDNFLESTSTDLHAVVVVDQNDKATIRFGNGINGKIPTGTVTIDYKTGGGASGQLEPNTLKKLDGGPYRDSLGTLAKLSATNPAETSGASDRATNAQIKLLAPASIRVISRAVAREDYEIVARNYPGVARALHLTRNQDPGIAENNGILFIVPTGGGAPSGTLLTGILGQFAPTGPFPSTNTYQLAAQTPLYLTVDLFVKLFKRQGYTAATVKANVLASLGRFFAISVDEDGEPDVNGTPNPLIDFGFNLKDVDGNPTNELAYSDIFNAVRDTAGVRKIGDAPSEFTLNGTFGDVDVGNFEFPILGAVTLIDGDTGLTL